MPLYIQTFGLLKAPYNLLPSTRAQPNTLFSSDGSIQPHCN